MMSFVNAVKEMLAKSCESGILNGLDERQMQCLYAYHDEAGGYLSEVRYEGFRKMSYDPQNSSDPNNWIRKCPNCGTIWVKTSGCPGATTCGARDFQWDQKGASGSAYRGCTGNATKMIRGTLVGDSKCVKDNAAGCGASMVWDQLPRAFSPQELQIIMGDVSCEFYQSSICQTVSETYAKNMRQTINDWVPKFQWQSAKKQRVQVRVPDTP